MPGLLCQCDWQAGFSGASCRSRAFSSQFDSSAPTAPHSKLSMQRQGSATVFHVTDSRIGRIQHYLRGRQFFDLSPKGNQQMKFLVLTIAQIGYLGMITLVLQFKPCAYASTATGRSSNCKRTGFPLQNGTFHLVCPCTGSLDMR
jgi:hypothetical protein